MQTMVKKELKENRRSLLIWMGAMLGMLIVGAAEYGVVMDAGEEIIELFESLPRVLAIFFGAESEIYPVSTPIGYYIMMYLWYCIIAFTHAAVVGSTIISKEERNRTAEFLFTKPYPRQDIITSKIIAAILNVFAMTLVTVIGNLILLMPQIEGESILSELFITMVAMFTVQLLFLFTGFLFSAIFSSYAKALAVSVSFVALTYFLMVIFELIEISSFLNILTPFMYFKGADLIQNGISLFYIMVTIVVVAIAGSITYSKYRKRDLHS